MSTLAPLVSVMTLLPRLLNVHRWLVPLFLAYCRISWPLFFEPTGSSITSPQ